MNKQISPFIKSPDDFRVDYNFRGLESRRIIAVLFENYNIMPSGNYRIGISVFPPSNQAIIIPCRGSGIALIKAKPKSKGRLISILDDQTHIRIKEGSRNYNYLFVFGSGIKEERSDRR